MVRQAAAGRVRHAFACSLALADSANPLPPSPPSLRLQCTRTRFCGIAETASLSIASFGSRDEGSAHPQTCQAHRPGGPSMPPTRLPARPPSQFHPYRPCLVPLRPTTHRQSRTRRAWGSTAASFLTFRAQARPARAPPAWPGHPRNQRMCRRRQPRRGGSSCRRQRGSPCLRVHLALARLSDVWPRSPAPCRPWAVRMPPHRSLHPPKRALSPPREATTA